MDISYYNKFSKVYDLFSPKWYYHKARNFGIKQLNLKEGAIVLNLPIGTGQNLPYFQEYMNNTGAIIGVDLSVGMLEKAKQKEKNNLWNNVQLLIGDASKINSDWIEKNVEINNEIDAVFCDLGLSGFPNWKNIIDNMLTVLKPNGIIVIMDWYIPKPTWRGRFIKWIGKGEVNRPIYQYLETKVEHFSVDTTL